MKSVIWVKYCAIAVSFLASSATGQNRVEAILWSWDLLAWLTQDSQYHGHKALCSGKGPVPGLSPFRSSSRILFSLFLNSSLKSLGLEKCFFRTLLYRSFAWSYYDVQKFTVCNNYGLLHRRRLTTFWLISKQHMVLKLKQITPQE